MNLLFLMCFEAASKTNVHRLGENSEMRGEKKLGCAEEITDTNTSDGNRKKFDVKS